MRNRIQRFMIGRYGFDEFGKFLVKLALILCIVDIFTSSKILDTWFLIITIYAYFRILSKNHYKRSLENQKFLALKNKVLGNLSSKNSTMTQRKTYHIYKCPTCQQKIRIPKGKGRICITCPRCKTEFTKKS